MFVALRDIRAAKGRFALIGAVVGLITLLVVLLSGLTAGLAAESTSAIENLPADRIAFGAAGRQAPEESYADSSVTAHQADAWSAAEGVDWAEPLGITQSRLEAEDGSSLAATVFAADPGGRLAPEGTADDALVIGESLAEEEGISEGDVLTLGGTELTVAAIGREDSYSHTPAVWTSLDTWRSFVPGSGDDTPVGTVVAAGADGTAEFDAVDTAAGTVSADRDDSLAAIGAFSSENGSLLMIQGFLYAISVLVVGAFLTVWTVQRAGDIAILKALGASTRYLLRDALGQSALVLLAGTAVGGGLGVALGALATGTVPFELTAATVLVPIAGMTALGMAGAVLAVRGITSVDPLTALGGVR
ncbi:putative ABC transport system permease protein [Murinocardiopsis flavida]|uniref:Putative ABC transport system permease protein n=1 Tax=Murinocardiopsis flavida TaxID=645275 RepID=A0A2P8C8C4_9ACTN|nr:ABC transporter permease [Murinocardiopsis flavida]PSK81214.1 putative ABC transport system permease protein [Murinocardiopsis flavida]